jgi:single-strand DNA-binding protein
MSGEPVITLVGNLVADPELRFTSSGSTVAKFRIASTPRYLDRQTNEWKDGDTVFLTCSAFRQTAENVIESLRRGTRVMVMGRLTQRSFQNEKDEQVTACEVEVDEVGPSLRNATARVEKTARTRVATAPAPSTEEMVAPARGSAREEQKVPF